VQRAYRWFGESAFLVDPSAGEDLHGLVAVLREMPEVEDVLAGARVLVRSSAGSAEAVVDRLGSIPSCTGPARPQRYVEIPVHFDGPDLEEVAGRASLSRHDLTGLLTDTELEVAYLGFTPGFAYMTGLPPAVGSISRRATPRTSVPAGSVAIGGGYLGIYPRRSPGGWNIVGRTASVMFDPEVPPYSALQPGDRVRLVESESIVAPRAEGGRGRPRTDSVRRLVVERAGSLTTLQDSGRRGVGHLGVPRAGPADRDMMRLANIVAGNDADEGVLETTFEGPALRFTEDTHVVVLAAAVAVGGRDLQPGALALVRAGEVLEVGPARGVHGYVAVAGAIRGPELFGSCSSDVLSGLGPGALVEGDELAIGDPGHPHGYAQVPDRTATVRVIPGPDLTSAALLAELVSEPFEVSRNSNRVGVRLEGRSLVGGAGVASGGSYGMVEGAVQLPPSGEPIVLLCDHATMGGYPVVATVVSADIGNVAQRRPGEEIAFVSVTRQDALSVLAERDRSLWRAPKGTFPTSGI
jgi:KipI family sensor histidine kinase inhibitor